jgi:dTDP-4-dehydrorhamnose 3,5-epimerase
MEIIRTEISDVIVFKPKLYPDDRGEFSELFTDKYYDYIPREYSFVQDNYSFSNQNVLRGLHYQINQPQGKLITCFKGNILDVAVDLRKRSKTFGKWVSVWLDGNSKDQIWIPPGFAHGFYTQVGSATILYKNTDYYSPGNERTLLWNDPTINILWNEYKIYPNLSNKDSKGKLLEELELFDF